LPHSVNRRFDPRKTWRGDRARRGHGAHPPRDPAEGATGVMLLRLGWLVATVIGTAVGVAAGIAIAHAVL